MNKIKSINQIGGNSLVFLSKVKKLVCETLCNNLPRNKKISHKQVLQLVKMRKHMKF